MELNDQIYIDKVINGNTNAFSVLVDRYKIMVYTLALKMLKHKEEAEEVSQDTFIKVYSKLNTFKGDAKFSTWVYKITYYTCLDRLRQHKKQRQNVAIDELNEGQVQTIDDSLERMALVERQEIFERCLKLLSPEESFLLTLYYYKELSLDEMAKILDLKTNHIKVKLFRCRKKLGVILKDKLAPEFIEHYGK